MEGGEERRERRKGRGRTGREEREDRGVWMRKVVEGRRRVGDVDGVRKISTWHCHVVVHVMMWGLRIRPSTSVLPCLTRLSFNIQSTALVVFRCSVSLANENLKVALPEVSSHWYRATVWGWHCTSYTHSTTVNANGPFGNTRPSQLIFVLQINDGLDRPTTTTDSLLLTLPLERPHSCPTRPCHFPTSTTAGNREFGDAE